MNKWKLFPFTNFYIIEQAIRSLLFAMIFWNPNHSFVKVNFISHNPLVSELTIGLCNVDSKVVCIIKATLLYPKHNSILNLRFIIVSKILSKILRTHWWIYLEPSVVWGRLDLLVNVHNKWISLISEQVHVFLFIT